MDKEKTIRDFEEIIDSLDVDQVSKLKELLTSRLETILISDSNIGLNDRFEIWSENNNEIGKCYSWCNNPMADMLARRFMKVNYDGQRHRTIYFANMIERFEENLNLDYDDPMYESKVNNIKVGEFTLGEIKQGLIEGDEIGFVADW